MILSLGKSPRLVNHLFLENRLLYPGLLYIRQRNLKLVVVFLLSTIHHDTRFRPFDACRGNC